jgi:hypothetical protein
MRMRHRDFPEALWWGPQTPQYASESSPDAEESPLLVSEKYSSSQIDRWSFNVSGDIEQQPETGSI